MHAHPYMFTIGCGLLGFMLPEILKAFARRPLVIPTAMNLWSMVGSGLVAAAFAF